jgi:nicotinamidase-related amidase/predicted MFS family arabinose efflux permease
VSADSGGAIAPSATSTEVARTERGRSPFGFTFIAPLVLGSVLNPINSTMLATALVPIAESLGTDIAATGWLIAALYLTTAVAQPTLGRLVDLLGARRIFLASLGLVGAAGLCGQFASTLAGLVAVRILLGVGTSGAYPAAMRILRERGEATGSKPPRLVFGVMTVSAFSTTAVGPVIGGLLVTGFGWQSIFTVNAPLALIAALSILIWTPRDRAPAHTFGRLMKDIDLIGIALFAAFLLSLMAFLMNLKNGPLWPALAGSIVFGAGLVWHSLRRKQPFLDVRMLARNWPLSMTYLRAAAISVIVFSVYYGFAQWLQSAVGYSSAGAGLVTLPMSVVAAAASLTGARIKGLRSPFLIAVSAALAGSVGLLLVDGASPLWMIVTAITLFGVTLGTFSMATQAAVYIQAPAEEIGTAAGLQRTAQYIGAIVAASLLASIYGEHASDHGLHSLAAVAGVLSAILFVVTLLDRTLSRAAATEAAAQSSAIIPQVKEVSMPLTTLDETPALVVIDLQKGIVGLPCVHPIAAIVDRAAELARAFRERGLPVILVNVAGRAPGRTEVPFNFTPPAGWTDLVPELDQQPSDYLVTKHQIGAFYGTALEQILRRRGVTQVVLAGVATSSGVEATARNAYDHGYNVTLVVDAMTDRSADAHRYSVEMVFPRLGETATAQDVLKALAGRRPSAATTKPAERAAQAAE